MKEHRNARLWIAFAAIAAIALLLAVGPRLHRESGGSRAPRASHEARELLKKSFTAAQFSPHRLEWDPEEVTLSNTVLDLCDDEQAVKAGLQTDALDDARHNLGIDCHTSVRRFGYILPHEELRVANSYEEADALLKEFTQTRTIKGESFPKRPGTLMGYSGSLPLEIGLDPCGPGFGCAQATIDVSRGATRGLFANASDQVAHDVTISAGNVIAHHPLSVQPGELTAFELPAELSAAELATLSIKATFVGSADPRRAVRMIGTPGEVEGPRDEVSRRCFNVDLPREPPITRYYMEGIMLEDPSNHPGAAQALPGRALQAPIAVVAWLDQRIKVVGVLRVPVSLSAMDGRPPKPVTTMSNELHSIGFVLPPEVVHWIISLGGAE